MKVPRAIRWVGRRAGRRGAFLAFLAVLDCSYGAAILTTLSSSGPRSLRQPDFLLPLGVWGWVWIGMGFVCATGIFMCRDRLQYGLSAMFKALWCLLFVFEWTTQSVPSAWVSVVIWAAFSLIVLLVAGWPEPPVMSA